MQWSFDIKQILLRLLNRDETLTGRTEIWEKVLEIGTNPLIGTGYHSFWLGDRAAKFWEEYYWHPNQAHNGYLEIYINLGYLGVFFLLCLVFNAYKNISKDLTSELGRFRISI